MKVAVLTYHNSPNNAGAVLQAYALQRTLEKMGHEACVIDYHRKFGDMVPWWSFKSVRGIYYTLKWFPLESIRLFKCRKFCRTYLNLTPAEYGKRVQYHDADAYIVGSDQVFNPVHNEGNRDFFLDFVPEGKKRIAYGASFGTSEFSDEYYGLMKALLPRFDALSVRERDGIDIIRRVSGRDASLVCDPTLLLDMREYDCARGVCNESEPFVFTYIIGNHPCARGLAVRVAKELGVKRVLVCSNRRAEWHWPEFGLVRNVFVYSPADFLAYIAKAAFVVTNSFHGTALSIVHRRNFLSLRNGTSGDNRMTTLLDDLGLGNRFVLGDSLGSDDYGQVDWRFAEAHLPVTQSQAADFLQKALH